jgi:hypothetical protein
MREGAKLYHFTFLALLALPIAVGYASTRQMSETLPAASAKAIPAIKWSLATTISDGTALASVLNASGAVAGSFSYTAMSRDGNAVPVTADSLLAVGDYTIAATFMPVDQTHYNSVTTTVPLKVEAQPNAELASW